MSVSPVPDDDCVEVEFEAGDEADDRERVAIPTAVKLSHNFAKLA